MQGADQASDLHTAPRQPSRQWTQAGLLGKVKSISPPQRASPSPASTTTKYAPRQKAASEWKPEPSFIPPARKMGLGKQVPGLSPVRTGWKSQQGLCDPMSAPSNKIEETDLRIRHLYFGNMTIFTLFVFLILIPFLFLLTFGKVHFKNVNQMKRNQGRQFCFCAPAIPMRVGCGVKAEFQMSRSRGITPSLHNAFLSEFSFAAPWRVLGLLLWYVRVVPSQYCIGNDWWMLDPLGGGAGGDGRYTVWTGFSSLSLLGGERFLVGGDWVFRCLSLQQLPLSSLASFVT